MWSRIQPLAKSDMTYGIGKRNKPHCHFDRSKAEWRNLPYLWYLPPLIQLAQCAKILHCVEVLHRTSKSAEVGP